MCSTESRCPLKKKGILYMFLYDLFALVQTYFIPLTIAIVVGIALAYITGIMERPFRYIYGDMTKAEAKKFLLYGALLFLIIGIYWELRCVKDSIFTAFVSAKSIGWAKIVSLVVVFPLVIGYSWLIDKFSRKHLFYVIAAIYASFFFVMAFLINNEAFGLHAAKENRWALLGWICYVMIESFGTLVVSLFYSFMADTTTPEAGKKAYFITATFAQIGAVLGSYLVQTQSECYGVPTLMTVGGFLTLLIPCFVWFILWVTPKHELEGYQAKASEHDAQKKSKPGFVESLKLIVSQPYLLSILFITCAFEIIVTVFDLQFKILIAEFAGDNASKFAGYAGSFGVSMGMLGLYSLLLGLGKVGRKIGITMSLVLMSIIVGVNIVIMTGAFMGWLSFLGAVFGISAATLPLTIVTWVQVASKGVNYALGQPSKEQLFIPTSKDAKYKSKGWIDMFGSRFSKASGSGIQIAQQSLTEWGVLATLGASTAFLMGTSFIVCVIWFFVAIYAGKTNQKAVDRNEIVC